MGFARGDETVDEEVESLHATATKESTATVTTESLSPAAEEDVSTPCIKPIPNVADSVIKDVVKHVPTSQPSQSAPIADSPADKQSTPSSSFMFDGMSLSAVKMQNAQQKESSLPSTASTAAGTLEAVNKQNAAPLGTKQEANGAEDGASKLTAKDDGPTSDTSNLPSQSTGTPVTPKVAVTVAAVTDSASSANKISDINFEAEPSSVTTKPYNSEKEESDEKESKEPSRSSSSFSASKEPAPPRQLRAALQPAYEQRGQVRGVWFECYIFSQRISPDSIQLHPITL